MTQPTSRPRLHRGIAVLCGVLVLVFLAAGVVKLAAIEFERHGFAHFGYAPWFMYFIGVVEIVGAVMMMMHSTRLAGTLLLAATMVGAVASHLRAGDGFGMATPAAVLLLLLIVVAAGQGGFGRRPVLRLARTSA